MYYREKNEELKNCSECLSEVHISKWLLPHCWKNGFRIFLVHILIVIFHPPIQNTCYWMYSFIQQSTKLLKISKLFQTLSYGLVNAPTPTLIPIQTSTKYISLPQWTAMKYSVKKILLPNNLSFRKERCKKILIFVGHGLHSWIKIHKPASQGQCICILLHENFTKMCSFVCRVLRLGHWLLIEVTVLFNRLNMIIFTESHTCFIFSVNSQTLPKKQRTSFVFQSPDHRRRMFRHVKIYLAVHTCKLF